MVSQCNTSLCIFLVSNGAKSIKSVVYERKKNGKFSSVVDFLKKVEAEVINKRQLEKLIQSGSFDSLEKNRSKLFFNVPQFVNLFGSNNNQNNQNLLFEEQEISFEDKNLFNQQIPEWNSNETLKNELEVVGFYFSDHPLKHYPQNLLMTSLPLAPHAQFLTVPPEQRSQFQVNLEPLLHQLPAYWDLKPKLNV